MPALAVGVVEVVRRFGNWRIPVRLLVGLVMAVSVAVQLVGATIGYEFSWNFIRPLAVARGETEAYLYAWKYFPIRDELGWLFTRTDLYVGRALPPTNSPMLFAVLVVLAVWGAGVAICAARRLERRLLAAPEPPPLPPAEPASDTENLVGATNAAT
jgi:hypothetical protein